MVSGRGLPPGLLGRRRPAQPLLPRGDPAEDPEAQEELPEPGEEGGGLSRPKSSLSPKAMGRGTAEGGGGAWREARTAPPPLASRAVPLPMKLRFTGRMSATAPPVPGNR